MNYFAALRKAIYQYNHIDELTPRKQDTVRRLYEQDTYTMDVVDDMASTTVPKGGMKKKKGAK